MEDTYNKRSDEELLAKDTDEKVIVNYKSMFYQFLARPDSMTQIYNKNALINLEDIYSLNDEVCEKLKNHREAGFLIKISIKYVNGKTMDFPNWRSFAEHKWYEAEAIKNIVIVWEFNAVLPNLNPSRHTLMVKLSNGLRPEEIINLMFTSQIEDLEEMDNNLFPIVARVDFVNKTLGDELINIVTQWVKGLKESSVQKSAIVLFLKKHKGIISSIANWITNIVIMCSSILIMGNYITGMHFKSVSEITNIQLTHIIYSVFVCVGVWIFGRRFVKSLTDKIFDSLRDYGETALFNITKGDKNKQDKIRKNEKKSKLSIVINLLITIIINILCGFFVNYIS